MIINTVAGGGGNDDSKIYFTGGSRPHIFQTVHAMLTVMASAASLVTENVRLSVS